MTAVARREPTILIVDDARSNLILLERVLRGGGYEHVVSTPDPLAVVRLFAKHHPDLVLVDLNMPGKDGFQVMRELRDAGDEQAPTPIVVLTATVDAEVKRRALAAGAVDFVSKPFDPDEVLLRVRTILGPQALRGPIGPPAVHPHRQGRRRVG